MFFGSPVKFAKCDFCSLPTDPTKLYDEEIKKQPCSRYRKGYCKYDLYCQFTHFNQAQLKGLEVIVENLKTKCKPNRTNRKHFISKSAEILNHTWQNKITKKNFKSLPPKLPPSLRPLFLKRLLKLNEKIKKWGD